MVRPHQSTQHIPNHDASDTPVWVLEGSHPPQPHNTHHNFRYVSSGHLLCCPEDPLEMGWIQQENAQTGRLTDCALNSSATERTERSCAERPKLNFISAH